MSNNYDDSLSNSSKNSEVEPIVWKDEFSLFKNRILTGIIKNSKHLDLRLFLNDAKKIICEKLNSLIKDYGNIKVHCSLACMFDNVKEENTIEEKKYFDTSSELLSYTCEIDKIIDDKINSFLLAQVEDFEECGSGWTMSKIIHLQVNIYHWDPFLAGTSSISVLRTDGIEHNNAGSSINLEDPSLVNESSYVSLPLFIQQKKAVLNIINEDRFSFFWSVIAALYPVKNNSGRVKSYKHYSEVPQLQGIRCPMTLHDIPKFESKTNISINVYGINDKKKIVPLHLSKYSNKSHIHLLMVEGKNESDINNETKPTFHFCLIKDLSRLVHSQISKGKTKSYFCHRCLNQFKEKQSFNKHRNDCIEMNKTRISFPENNEPIKFKNFRNKEKIPFVVYADLECILQSDYDDKQKHIPHSVAFYVHCSYDNSKSRFDIKRGTDCINWFILKLKELADKVGYIVKNPKPMKPLTSQEKENYQNAKKCHICENLITNSIEKVRDHCHFTGKYRGAAHNDCNLNYKAPNFIPVVFHNLSGYDSHFLIKPLAKSFKGQLKVLPINKEKYLSFTKSVHNSDNKNKNKRKSEITMKLKFIDSFRFMNDSISNLASYLDDSAKTITKRFFTDPEQFKLVIKKGVFPYEYIDKWDKFDETHLPEQLHFFSKLNNKAISNKDYQHALNVWNTFKLETLGQYSDLYLKTDVLLLADIFENFRNNCFEAYALDPLHYPTAPSLTFDAMLKYTKIELDVLQDVEMLNFIEKGIRGGVSQCCNRYAKANNRYMGDDYDPDDNESYLMYFDINNLYGVAMSEPLPTGSFKWANDEFNIENIHDSVCNISEKSKIGYIFEVDLDYPKELHQRHKDLPLCPEHRKPPDNKIKKLMTTLYPKNKYVIHYRNLQQCIKLGLKISKIHRVLKFQQSQWLKKYIDLNTDKRKKSKNKFEENFFKLMNNAVFGKTMENVRKYKDIKIVTKWEGRYGARSLIAKPDFHRATVLDDNETIIIEMKRLDILFNKPIYLGFAILDLSKIFLYDFHYNYILNTFDNENVKLMYTDTDSLIYNFININIYDYIKRDLHRFDTSNYPENNIYGIPLVNKKVLGLMKDENKGIIMTEFIGLRAKLYSFKTQGEVEKKKAKGIKMETIRNKIKFDDYKKCLRDYKTLKVDENHIISQNHEVSTVQKTKRALTWNDDKRQLISHSTDTLPWGYEHERIGFQHETIDL